MKKLLTVLLFGISLFANDITVKSSNYSVDETVENIKSILAKKGLTLFDVIDHKANAENVGMSLNEAKLIIFGNPKVGTRLMQEDLSVALDLPLKILVYKDHDNKVKVAYRDGEWIKANHPIQADNLIKKINGGLNAISDTARRKVNP